MKKKPGPLPTGKGQQVVVRLQPDVLSAIDEYRAHQPDFDPVKNVPSRPEIIRRLIAKAFEEPPNA